MFFPVFDLNEIKLTASSIVVTETTNTAALEQFFSDAVVQSEGSGVGALSDPALATLCSQHPVATLVSPHTDTHHGFLQEPSVTAIHS